MKTTTATLRTFRVARLIPNGIRHTAIVRAESPAAAVREAVLKRVRVCDGCGGKGIVYDGIPATIHGKFINRKPCPTCHGRGVVEGET